MRKAIAVAAVGSILLLVGAACSSGGDPSENTELSAISEAAPVAIAEVEPGSEAVVEVAAVEVPDQPEVSDSTATFDVEGAAEPQSEPEPEIPALYLELTSPANETIVKTANVEVSGNTTPTAIVSVNGALTSVNSEGGFTATAALEVGPNFIEVVTSDLQGEEIGKVVTIVYLPS